MYLDADILLSETGIFLLVKSPNCAPLLLFKAFFFSGWPSPKSINTPALYTNFKLFLRSV